MYEHSVPSFVIFAVMASWLQYATCLWRQPAEGRLWPAEIEIGQIEATLQAHLGLAPLDAPARH